MLEILKLKLFTIFQLFVTIDLPKFQNVQDCHVYHLFYIQEIDLRSFNIFKEFFTEAFCYLFEYWYIPQLYSEESHLSDSEIISFSLKNVSHRI